MFWTLIIGGMFFGIPSGLFFMLFVDDGQAGRYENGT